MDTIQLLFEEQRYRADELKRLDLRLLKEGYMDKKLLLLYYRAAAEAQKATAAVTLELRKINNTGPLAEQA
jgi:hypothetical protein